MIPQVISDEFLFLQMDKIKEEDYEYGSFAQSKDVSIIMCGAAVCHKPLTPGKIKK
jgi:hypothetical protein